jgi:hypothetical protein
MSARAVVLAGAGSLAFAALCSAQQPSAGGGPGDDTWRRWVEQSVSRTRGGFEAEAAAGFETHSRDAARADIEARRTSYVAVREPSLAPETSASSVERLTAALKTDVADAEAGVSVAPFLLFGSEDDDSQALDGVSFILASLKEGKTRIGAKWAYIGAPEPPASLRAIGLAACKFDEAAVRADLDILRTHFNALCEVIQAHLPRPEKEEEARVWDRARAACGAGGDPPNTLIMARQLVKEAVDQARPRATAAQSNAIDDIASSLAWVDFRGPHRVPLATGCYTPKALKLAYRQHEWARTKVKFGFLASADHFPRRSGFNPDESKPLPRGQNAARLIQAEAAVEKRGFSLVGSLAWARGRAKFDDKTYTSLRPAVSLSFAVARLGGGPLTDKDRRIRLLEDGSLPPMLVAGFLAKLDYARTRPDAQTSKLNAAEYQLFLDFRISEKLSFRLGVPYKGELVTRAANNKVVPEILERRAIQWSLPVFVATVIKL